MGAGADAAPPSAGRNETEIASAIEPRDLKPLTGGSLPLVSERAGKYNTSNLGLRLLADGAAALSAGALVAPLITIIDK